MARGPKKTIEEKITAKQELISALLIRVESEQKELEALYEEKRNKELESISNMIVDAGLSTEEAEEAIQRYIDSKAEYAS